MPIESFEAKGLAQAPYNRHTVLPGCNAVIAEDHTPEGVMDIVAECNAHDIGGNIYKVSREARQANHGGITEAMRRQCHIGSLATKGVLEPALMVSDARGGKAILHVEHTTEKFRYNPADGRLRQVRQ